MRRRRRRRRRRGGGGKRHHHFLFLCKGSSFSLSLALSFLFKMVEVEGRKFSRLSLSLSLSLSLLFLTQRALEQTRSRDEAGRRRSASGELGKRADLNRRVSLSLSLFSFSPSLGERKRNCVKDRSCDVFFPFARLLFRVLPNNPLCEEPESCVLWGEKLSSALRRTHTTRVRF